jgi:mono/diheme cytochrome c family protein
LTRWRGLGPAALIAALPLAPAMAADPDAIARGAYLAAAAGCETCHTDGKNNRPALAGGRELKTPFGSFYTPNITPDPQFGIGKWSDADFLRALRKGVSPSRSDYYPAFPYVSFTLLKDADILDIKAWLFSRPPVPLPNKPHDLAFPYSVRLLMAPWKILYFREGPFHGRPAESAEWNRGSYLVKAVAHCGECHTPRNALGATDKSRRLAGVDDGPGGINAPDITSHPDALGKWSTADIEALLKDGITPDGDFVGKEMKEVVAETTRLTADDLHAIGVYLKTVPPQPPPPKHN